MTLSPSGGGVA